MLTLVFAHIAQCIQCRSLLRTVNGCGGIKTSLLFFSVWDPCSSWNSSLSYFVFLQRPFLFNSVFLHLMVSPSCFPLRLLSLSVLWRRWLREQPWVQAWTERFRTCTWQTEVGTVSIMSTLIYPKDTLVNRKQFLPHYECTPTCTPEKLVTSKAINDAESVTSLVNSVKLVVWGGSAVSVCVADSFSSLCRHLLQFVCGARDACCPSAVRVGSQHPPVTRGLSTRPHPSPQRPAVPAGHAGVCLDTHATPLRLWEDQVKTCLHDAPYMFLWLKTHTQKSNTLIGL